MADIEAETSQKPGLGRDDFAELQQLRQEKAEWAKSSANAPPKHEEYQYLDLIRTVLQHGEHRPDRYDMALASQATFMLTLLN